MKLKIGSFLTALLWQKNTRLFEFYSYLWYITWIAGRSYFSFFEDEKRNKGERVALLINQNSQERPAEQISTLRTYITYTVWNIKFALRKYSWVRVPNRRLFMISVTAGEKSKKVQKSMYRGISAINSSPKKDIEKKINARSLLFGTLVEIM